jgi:hypothetical protein
MKVWRLEQSTPCPHSVCRGRSPEMTKVFLSADDFLLWKSNLLVEKFYRKRLWGIFKSIECQH